MTKVVIEYCKPCGYLPRATDVANVLKDRLGVDAELLAGTAGIFEVRVNGIVVAKRTRGHFPVAEEVVTQVAAALPGASHS
jgi:selenoprotein W-related protein